MGHDLPSSLPFLGQFHRFLLLPRAAARELGRGWERLAVSALSETLRKSEMLTAAAQ